MERAAAAMDDSAEAVAFTLSAEATARRLDVALAELMAGDQSRSRIQAIIREGGVAWEKRIQFASQQVLQRDLDAEEKEILRTTYGAALRESHDQPEERAKLFGVGLTQVDPGIDPATLYAWTAVARTLFNLSETVTRN